MNERGARPTPDELADLPAGWILTGQYVVPFGTVLEFHRRGLFGPKLTVTEATFHDAWREGCIQLRLH